MFIFSDSSGVTSVLIDVGLAGETTIDVIFDLLSGMGFRLVFLCDEEWRLGLAGLQVRIVPMYASDYAGIELIGFATEGFRGYVFDSPLFSLVNHVVFSIEGRGSGDAELVFNVCDMTRDVFFDFAVAVSGFRVLFNTEGASGEGYYNIFQLALGSMVCRFCGNGFLEWLNMLRSISGVNDKKRYKRLLLNQYGFNVDRDMDALIRRVLSWGSYVESDFSGVLV